MKLRVYLSAFVLLMCLSGAAGAATLSGIVITNGNPTADNRCTVRDAPMPVTIYRLTDPQLFLWYVLDGVHVGDAPKAEFVDPNGSVYRTVPWSPSNADGNFCYTYRFEIASAVPRLTPGSWTVRILLNNNQLGSTRFTILDPASCRYELSITSATFERQAASGTILVTTDALCQWTAAASAAWIYITSGASGTGNGTVRFSVAENTGPSRAGTITIGGQIVTVTQYGSGTVPALALAFRMVRTPPSGCDAGNPPTGVSTFPATDPEAYLWIAVDNVNIGDVLAYEATTPSGARYAGWGGSWPGLTAGGRNCLTTPPIRIAGAEAASLPGSWTVRVTLNGAPLLSLSFTIQATTPVGCNYSLSSTSRSVAADGGTFTVTVSTGTGCQWTAASNATWISITSGASGRGGGTVTYRVSANTTTAARTGTLTIAGATFTLTQSGAQGCTYALEPASATVPIGGGRGSVNVRVRTGSDCRWTAASNASWLTVVTGATGAGNGSVVYSAAPNSGIEERSGTLTIAGLTFALRQAGLPSYSQATLTTVAGTDWIFPSGDQTALDAPLGAVESVTADRNGNLYVTDRANCIVVRVAPEGVLGVVAGNGTCGFSGDGGAATSASLAAPTDVQVDEAGNLFIADYENHRIRKVDLNGVISTIAGNGTNRTSGDGGPAAAAALGRPLRLALNAAGNLYVVSDLRVRLIAPDGGISTAAGNGEARHSGDGGPATEASFLLPQGIAVDGSGNLYVSDWGANRIRVVKPGGTIETFAGDGQRRFAGDSGPAASASFYSPYGLAVDSAGNLYVADTNNRRVRKIAPDGTVSTVAGNGEIGFSGDGGPAVEASLFWPHAVGTDAAGAVYVADTGNQRVRAVSPDGTIRTVAGNGRYRAADDGWPATNLFLDSPGGFTRDAQRAAYIADTENHRVWRVAADGTAAAFAGRGQAGCCSDGNPAVTAFLSAPSDVAVDAQGEVYIADSGNHRIRKVSADGRISTWAGTGTAGFGGDGGPAARAQFYGPAGLAFDYAGNLYVADVSNHRVRKISPNGTVVTAAGTGEAGSTGDGGTATDARLYYPTRVAVDQTGNLYIADRWNHRIRKVSTAGIITTVAGNGVSGFSGDGGPATQARLNFPEGVALDAAGNLLIADTYNHRVRVVTPDGTIFTIAGNGKAGFAGDGGRGTDGSLNRPVDIEVSGDTIYVLDKLNNRLRSLQIAASAAAP